MAEKRGIKNKQISHKSLKREKLHARQLPLLQYWCIYRSVDSSISINLSLGTLKYFGVINLEYSKLNITFQYPKRIFSKLPKKTVIFAIGCLYQAVAQQVLFLFVCFLFFKVTMQGYHAVAAPCATAPMILQLTV